MSFDDFVITCKTLDELHSILNEKLTKTNTYTTYENTGNTIYIVHIHIGSKTHMSIHHTDTATHKRNHEYTSFLKTLFNEPKKQFSPEFISQLSQLSQHSQLTNTCDIPVINIKNSVILIDPMYSHSPLLEGFNELEEQIRSDRYVTISSSTSITKEHLFQHENSSLTMINTSIEIIKVPFDVNDSDIIKIIAILNDTDTNTNTDTNTDTNIIYSVLINIMDCTSQVLVELYAKINSKHSLHSNNYQNIYITRPDCMILDTLPRYKPTITRSMKNLHSGKISIRWINYYDDKEIIPDLEQILDIGLEQILETHTFLTENYKYNSAIENLVSIVKLWSRLSYSNLQEIDIGPDTYLHNNGSRTSILTMKFCELSFTDFITYWTQFIKFREFIVSNVDNYYKYNLNLYLDTFIFKYEEISNHIHIVKALQIEAIEIFKQLLNYCKKDAEYIISHIKGIEDDTSHLLERKQIMDYLIVNDVSI